MALQTFQLEHLPTTQTVQVALFRDVKNAAFLQQQLLDGNTEFEYAFIDASVILSRLHALSAAFRALNDLQNDRLRSRNVHSEIVFSLSPNSNISESFRRFGVQPTTTNLLVMKVDITGSARFAAEVQEHLSKVVEGEQVAFEDEVLRVMTDLGRVRKIYKLNAGSEGKKGAAQVNAVMVEDERRELEVLVIGCMALRGATN